MSLVLEREISSSVGPYGMAVTEPTTDARSAERSLVDMRSKYPNETFALDTTAKGVVVSWVPIATYAAQIIMNAVGESMAFSTLAWPNRR